MSRRGKIIAAVLLPVLAALVLVSWALHGMAEEDRRHARFYNAGKTINAFLGSYCQGIEAAVEGRDPSRLAAFYSRDYRSPERGRWVWGAGETETGAVVSKRLRDGRGDFTAAELAVETAEYLAGFQGLDKSICKIDLISEVELASPEGSKRNNQEAAVLTVKIILDGVAPDGRWFQDRHILRWHLRNEAGEETAAAGAAPAHVWKIARDELVEGFRVAGDRGGLIEADVAALGIDFEHRRDPDLDMKRFASRLRFGVIQHASGGVSAADFDGDDRPDLLLLDGERLRLYRNLATTGEGEPRFADVTAEAGLDGIGRTHVGVFADFDNDGDRDLFLGRHLVPSMFWVNDGAGRFRDASAEMGVEFAVPASSATLLDYDRDGFVDVYLAAYGHAFEALPRLPFFAQNGRPNVLLRNDGGRRFVDVTEESGTGDVGWSLAVAAGDVDGDGWTDLAVANDFGRKNLYLNGGDGTFREVAKEAGVLDFSGGMGLAFGDFDDDGAVDLYTSNINSNQRWFGEDRTVGQYIRNVARTRYMLADFLEYLKLYRLIGSDWVELGQQIGEGNSLFRNRGAGAVGEVAFEELKDSHTGRAGWGWSVAFLDVDNDADLDLYAANGWISNTPDTDL